MAEIESRAVFVVHGRNDEIRRAMFDFLRSIELSPMEWDSAVALTGEGTPYVGQVLDAAFDRASAVVVVMTPDEVAYLDQRYAHGDQDPETQPAAQARPNVLFEAGMALGRHASRTVLVEVGQVRPFSDVAGRHVLKLDNSVASRQALAKRLETAGCDVNLGGTDWHTTGNFDPPPPPGGGLVLGRRIPSQAPVRPPIDFDLRYVNKGGNRIDKLQVINRGTEAALEVELQVPADAGISIDRVGTIPKIPGGGKSVTVDVLNENRFMGSNKVAAFDISVSARTESGETFTQQVFLDMNG